MDKTTIIVVEDNIVYCEFVCNMLAREGYRTVKAYHLSTAKKHLQQATDNDIVVADLRLPDGNGIDLLRWMRKEGKMQRFPISSTASSSNPLPARSPPAPRGRAQRPPSSADCRARPSACRTLTPSSRRSA